MASSTVTISPTSGPPGTVITATYTVTGADPESKTITGHTTVDGVDVPASATFTTTHVVGNGAPTAPGLTFVATADPKVWKATA